MIPIDSALFYLHEKVKNDPKSTDNEKQAVDTIIQWINDSKNGYIKENLLFQKLYIIYFGILIDSYKDIMFAQKQLHKDLSENINFHEFWLTDKINVLENQNFDKSIGLINKHPKLFTPEEKIINDEIVKKHQDDYLNHLNLWSQEKVHTALQNQISEAINRFQHYD